MTAALAVHLDRSSAVPLVRQLADAVRDQVVDGRLHPGDRLPSSRALAAELGTARAVVEQAWAQLVAEGWLEGRPGRGTFVAGVPAAAPPRSPARARAAAPAPSPDLLRLDTGTPWVEHRGAAEQAWRRAWREVSTARPPRGYDDPAGLPELRALVAGRLGRLRGLRCSAEDVAVVAGTTDGLRHLLGALPPGAVAIEDPGYRAAVATVRATGREVRDVVVPPEGPWPAADLDGCAAAYCTPAHQHPLGLTMPGPARVALLRAAREAGTVVVEDDYDSEFRYDVAPLPALAALDGQRVAYVGTASKAVAPSLRLGWMVAPPALAARVAEHRALTHEAVPWPVQRAFVALLRDGYVDRVVRAARAVYAARALRVEAALAPFGLCGPVAGMYATLRTAPAAAEAARAEAQRAGFDVPLLADHARTAPLHGLVVGFGGCTDDQLDRALAALVRGLRSAQPPAAR